MRRAYTEWAPRPDAVDIITKAEAVCRSYQTRGFDLTLRQLYYQFVARAWLPNTMQSYKRLGDIVNQARLAGLLSWDYIVDRTRNLAGNSHWTDPESIIDSAASSFRLDKWVGQATRVEVWVEKEALAGVIGQVARARDVDYFACRGYVSQSEQWRAARRIGNYMRAGQDVMILHLGDHDPSGIDMTRDIVDRLRLFLAGDGLDPDRLTVSRIALNMDQVEEYGPPPNPAKLTDSRIGSYLLAHGDQSWELDALPPETLAALINQGIDAVVEPDAYAGQVADEARHRTLLERTARRWSDVVDFIEDGENDDD